MNINKSIPRGQHRRLKERVLCAYREAVGKHGHFVTIESVPAMLVVLHEDAEKAILAAFDRRRAK